MKIAFQTSYLYVTFAELAFAYAAKIFFMHNAAVEACNLNTMTYHFRF